MKKTILLLLLTLNSTFADTIGGEVSLGIYSHSPSGSASYTSTGKDATSSSDIQNTLGWSDNQDVTFKAYLEHPFPFIPNIKLGLTKLSHDGATKAKLFSWGDTIDYSGKIKSELSLQINDLTLYYEILDNWVETDIGITARYINGDININTQISKENVDFSTWIPMVYAKARFNVPTTDLSLQLEANAISYSGATFYDYELSARYSFTMGFGVEAGYRVLHLDSDDLTAGLKSNMDFSGAYVAAVWDF